MRFYGGSGTIHGTTHLDIELDEDGQVSAVWFRCLKLPFKVHADYGLETIQDGTAGLVELHGVRIADVGEV